MKIRKATTDDAPAIRAIYNYYIEYTAATFETIPVSVSGLIDYEFVCKDEMPGFILCKDFYVAGFFVYLAGEFPYR